MRKAAKDKDVELKADQQLGDKLTELGNCQLGFYCCEYLPTALA